MNPDSPDEGFEREIPSPEELEALLGPAATNRESPESGRAPFLNEIPPRVLLASRSEGDLETLTRVLGNRHVEISATRNPFTALDYLRARLFHGMITDYSMWAAQGALLFRRMTRDLDCPVPVVFICDDERGETFGAESSAAVGVLTRPIDEEELRGVLNLFFEGDAPVEVAEARQGGSTAASEPTPDGSAVEDTVDNNVFELADAPSDPDDSLGDRAEVDTANPGRLDGLEHWFRFFFDARRALRHPASAQRRREHIFELLLKTHGAAAAALVSQRSSPEAEARLAIRTAYLNRSLDASRRIALLKRLLGLLSRLPEGFFTGMDRSGAVADRIALVVPYSGTDDSNFLAMLPAEGQELSPLPGPIVEELAYLLGDIARLSGGGDR